MFPSQTTSVDDEDEETGSEESVDLVELAHDQIVRHISSMLVGHAFTRRIDAILQADGFQTTVSPPGSDKGIDIVAGQGTLDFDGPRLVVQFKSGDLVADQPTLQSLIGCIQGVRADRGLPVSWSGFTAPVRQRVNELHFCVRLWGRDEILNALFRTYDKLPENIRSDLPLQRIWACLPQEDPQ